MPQGRRKIPFSGKAKKLQLQSKKNDEPSLDIKPTPVMPNPRNRYQLKFELENRAEIEASRLEAMKPYTDKSFDLESSIDKIYPPCLDFPIRPYWEPLMSKEEFDKNEETYFKNYVENIRKNRIGYFELNLETWRQLWRVLEMSDVLLLVVDARYVSAMCPPSLLTYVLQQNKDVIIVLNKIDLIPQALSVAWKNYLESKFGRIYVVFFTSCPNYNLVNDLSSSQQGLKFRKMKGVISMVTDGAQQILEACQKIAVDRNIDLREWEELIHNNSSKDKIHPIVDEKSILTIGMVGQPNSGKSSLINSLMGQKVVSVSRTPGHTKHFQTIFITSNVKLCDCPGLVFPSFASKHLQILMGSYPISQIREPTGTINFLCERIPLPQLLGLSNPNPNGPWTAFNVCEAWADLRGYTTAKHNRLDVNRAANHLLRMTLQGKICLTLKPPFNFTEAFYDDKETEEELQKINKLLGLHQESSGNPSNDYVSDDDDDEENDEENDDDDNTIITNKFDILMSLEQ